MRLNKKLQYGFLLALYLNRSGRATIENAAINLRLSRSFLEQVARTLRIKGILASSRGSSGGYTLIGDPTVQTIFQALSPVSLLSEAELTNYSRGDTEHRAFAFFISNMNYDLAPSLRATIGQVNSINVINELDLLEQAIPTDQAN